MEHPGEHSIELHVLRAPQGEPEREQIEAHLKECAGCRILADAAAAFYEELQADMLTRPATDARPSRSLVATSGGIPAIFDIPFRERRLSQVLPAGLARRFVRAHPFVAVGGGLALLGGCVALMLTFDLMPRRDLNPVTVIENQNQNTLDAYNGAGEKLWSYPVPRLNVFVDQEERTGRKYLQLADLDG